MCLPRALFFAIPKTINVQIYFLSSFGGPEKIASFPVTQICGNKGQRWTQMCLPSA